MYIVGNVYNVYMDFVALSATKDDLIVANVGSLPVILTLGAFIIGVQQPNKSI